MRLFIWSSGPAILAVLAEDLDTARAMVRTEVAKEDAEIARMEAESAPWQADRDQAFALFKGQQDPNERESLTWARFWNSPEGQRLHNSNPHMLTPPWALIGASAIAETPPDLVFPADQAAIALYSPYEHHV